MVRPDMIHLLMEARKGHLKYEEEDQSKSQDAGFATVEESQIGKVAIQQKKEISDMDIAAQALIFFFAGFDTVSTLMSFMAHELAVNPDVQEKLHQEIEETLKECDGEVSYEALVKMKYLDMVISETLRKWPPAVGTDRICVNDYVIDPVSGEETPLVIEKGTSVMIPILGLHYDAKYFPNPDKFDPERFSNENKGNIIPYSYMPFGMGPRNCIGSRFALLEMKILFYCLLSKFEIVPIGRTVVPMRITKKTFKMAPDDGFWLGLKRR